MAAYIQGLKLGQEALQAQALGSSASAQEAALDKLRVLVWLSQHQISPNMSRSRGQQPQLLRLALLKQPLLTSLHAGYATVDEGDPIVLPPAAAPSHAGLAGSYGQGVTDPMASTQEEPGVEPAWEV
ncbi:hypothetical protein HaLaN_07707 [Haematococcus lacustris]|uniref:Uncharacterized protein n=1 Tax=Haematococcus lacustris TaxID=44745 RepID=A0A699YZM7_HAELA|nr:hypothetical protein HaLaN_07707 [Haematococcus lacustris]